MSDEFTPKEEEMLKLALGRLKTKLALVDMGIPLRPSSIDEAAFQAEFERRMSHADDCAINRDDAPCSICDCKDHSRPANN